MKKISKISKSKIDDKKIVILAIVSAVLLISLFVIFNLPKSQSLGVYLTSSSSGSASNCQSSNGQLKQFSNICQDKCAFQNINGHCPKSLQPKVACDCGPQACWSGKKCVVNQDF